MSWRHERAWWRVERLLWVAVAVLFHAAILLAVFYWPVQVTPPPVGPLKVSLVTGNNPYLDQRREGPPVVPNLGVEHEEPLPPEEPPPRAQPEARPQPEQPAEPLPEPPQVPTPPADVEPVPQPPTDLASLLTPTIPAPSTTGEATRPAATVGIDTTTLAGQASGRVAFGNRFGQAKEKAIAEFGGTPGSVQAVADALVWLAAHQEPNGHWDRVGFARHCPPMDHCDNQAKRRLDRNCDVGMTALCLLAFLGDGHLPDRKLDLYADTVKRAIAWIKGQQQETGQFSVAAGAVRFDPDDPVEPVQAKDPLLMYNHSIATLALAEAYALTGDRELIEPVMGGLSFLARTQQPEGGWDYWPHETHRNDTSITGWAVMALKAAAAAGIPVPEMTIYKSAGHFARATEPDGSVRYSERGTGVRFNRDTGLPIFRYGPGMAAVGAASRLFLGYRPSSPGVIASANFIARDPPSLARFRGGDPTDLHSQYYWYYGTMAMFQIGGKHWEQWNPIMQRTLLGAQDRTRRPDGRQAHRYGSWPAYGLGWGRTWGEDGGRVYATAINALTLEVFYRYLPLYEQPADYNYTPVVEQILAAGNPLDQRRMVAWLGELRQQMAEPLLYRLLKADSQELRLAAAIELASFASPLARTELERQRNWVAGADKLALEQALMSLPNRPIPKTFGPVLDVDAKRGLASFRTGDNYVGFGLPVAAHDAAGKAIVRMQVASIDRERGIAVARLAPDDKAVWSALQPGQTVKLHWK